MMSTVQLLGDLRDRGYPVTRYIRGAPVPVLDVDDVVDALCKAMSWCDGPDGSCPGGFQGRPLPGWLDVALMNGLRRRDLSCLIATLQHEVKTRPCRNPYERSREERKTTGGMVSYRHWPRWPEFDSLLMGFSHRQPQLTVAAVILGEKGNECIYAGYALCNPVDNFSRLQGRSTARRHLSLLLRGKGWVSRWDRGSDKEDQGWVYFDGSRGAYPVANVGVPEPGDLGKLPADVALRMYLQAAAGLRFLCPEHLRVSAKRAMEEVRLHEHSR